MAEPILPQDFALLSHVTPGPHIWHSAAQFLPPDPPPHLLCHLLALSSPQVTYAGQIISSPESGGEGLQDT